MRDFRAAYPQYDTLGDEEVLNKVRREQFGKLSDTEWANKTKRLRPQESDRVVPDYTEQDTPKARGIRRFIPRTEDMDLEQTIPTKKWEGEFHEQMQGAGARGMMSLARGVMNLPKQAIKFMSYDDPSMQAKIKLLTSNTPDEELSPADLKVRKLSKGYGNLLKEHKQGIDSILNAHPEWEYDPPENFKELASDPRYLALALTESAPVMAGAGVLTAAGQPHLAMTMLFAVEGQEAKDEALAYGATEDQADQAYFIYGSVAAVLESMQIKGVMKLGKRAYNQALNRTAQKVLQAGGGSLKKQFIMTMARESLEEMAQGSWQEATAKMIYDKPVAGGLVGFVDRRLQEGYIGGAMGVIGGGAGYTGGKVRGAASFKAKAHQEFADRLNNVNQAPELAEPSKLPIGKQRYDARKRAKDTGLDPKEISELSEQVSGKSSLHNMDSFEIKKFNAQIDTLDDIKTGTIAPRSPADVPTVDKPAWLEPTEFSAWQKGELSSMAAADQSLTRRGFITEKGDPAEGTSISQRAQEVSPVQAIREATEMLSAELDTLTTDYVTGLQRQDRPFVNPKFLVSFRPTWRIINDTGLSPVLDRPLRARIDYEYDLHNTTNQIANKIKDMNKEAETPVSERVRRKIKNEPTEIEKYMAHALNEYEDAPSDMPENLTVYFNYFRDLTRDTLLRENMARMQSKLPVIPNRNAYFRHVLNTDAAEMVQGLRPFPAKLQYWSEKLYGRRFKNAMEIERTIDTVSDELWNIFSEDMNFVMTSMVRTAFREIYLNEPVKKAYAMMAKFQPSEEDLLAQGVNDPAELRHYEMPKLTRDFAEEFIKTMIRDEQTNLDEHLNTAFRESRAGKVVDAAMHKFGRSLSRRPLSELNLHLTSATRMGVLGFRPKLLIRNKFQLTQLLGLYPSTKVMHAFGKTPEWLKPIMENSQFIRTYTGLEDAPADFISKAERIWQGAYMATAVSNARQAFKVAAFAARDMVLTPKYRAHGWADPMRSKDTPDGYLFPSEIEKIEMEAEWGAKATQYQYLGATMPWVYRNKTMRFATQLQSWWMNHFFNFHEEAFHRLRTGSPAWSNGEVTLPMKYRLGQLRYLTVGGAILTALGYSSSYLVGVAPKGWPPLSQFLVSLYNYFTGASEHREWRKREMLNALKTMIPGYVAFKDVKKAWTTGEWMTLFKYENKQSAKQKRSGKRRKVSDF